MDLVLIAEEVECYQQQRKQLEHHSALNYEMQKVFHLQIAIL
jgi:hypothetical protein